MKYKKTVLLGMVCSAFLATLLLFEWVPALVAAFIILCASLLATVYIALNQVLVEKIKGLELVMSAQKRLLEQQEAAPALKELTHWVRLAVPSQRAFIYPMDNDGSESPENEWHRVSCLIADQRKVLIWPGPGLNIEVPGDEVQSFLGTPICCGEKMWAILYLVNRQDNKEFSEQDQDRVQFLVKQVESALKKDSLLAECRSFYKELLSHVIRGLESPDFKGHSERVADLASLLGNKLGMNDEEGRNLVLAAYLHDLGKAGPLDMEGVEQEGLDPGREHPQRGADFFPTEQPFGSIKEAILYHHERYNGSGYPEGLLRNDIPLAARVIAVADIYDALTCLGEPEHRLNPADAVAVIKKAIGTLFDPMVVVVLEELLPELETENIPAS